MSVQMPDWAKARVVVVGDVMLDRYWYGGTSRISPEAPVPVVHVQSNEQRVGGAGNVALNIAALGGRAGLAAVVGNDENGQALRLMLNQFGVIDHMVESPGYSTVTKLRVISRHQQLIRLDFEDPFDPAPSQTVQGALAPFVDDYDVVILSDYNKGVVAQPQALIKLARARGKAVLIDPKSRDFSRYAGASVVTPNLAEFEAVVGPCESDSQLIERAQNILTEFNIDALLITRGELGMILVRTRDAAVNLPTHAREVFDVTGAGDTVIGVLGAGLSAGCTLEDAMYLSNVAAGIVVGKVGTATVSVQELRAALRETKQSQYGILSQDDLTLAVHEARASGETVVMTNGCFDILHAGHVRYLEQARKLGDRLVVAVNDDVSVAKLKGRDRPINPLEDRMAVLVALGSVDWVVPFSEDTPERLICAVQPNILVKGGDYKEHEVAGGECVKSNGGRVVILPFVENRSTTRIIDAIRAGGDGGLKSR